MRHQPKPAPTPFQQRRSWLIIFRWLTLSALLYGFLAFSIENSRVPRLASPSLPTLRPAITWLAVAMLGASVAWLHFKTRGKMSYSEVGLMKPEEFQAASIGAMALAEACSILGFLLFILGQTLREFAPFIAGTLIVFFAFILPRGLRFWSAWNESQKSKPPSPFS